MREAGVQAIIQKIRADAEKHSRERAEEIRRECDELIKEEDALMSDDFAKRRENLLANNEHEHAVLLARLNNRTNRELSIYRHSLLDEIYEKTAAKLTAASDEEFAGMFSLLTEGLKGDFVLYMGQNSVGKLSNKTLEKAMAKNSDLRVSLSDETIPYKSGFLLGDERVEYNCLFEDIIENHKNEQTALILKEIFGEFV
jgi:vacuolar-type H+-ATPase subunit E/Vma4